MAYSFVSGQIVEADNTAGGTTIVSPALTSTPTVGNKLVCWVFFFDAAVDRTITVADGASHSFTEISGAHIFNTTDGSIRMFYLDVVSGTTGTITATYSASVTFRQIIVAEYSGLASGAPTASISNHQTGIGTTTDGVTTGNMTPASQPGAIIAYLCDASVATVINTGTGFTSRFGAVTFSSGSYSLVEDKRFTSTSAAAGTGTLASGTANTCNSGAMFLEPASGSRTTPIALPKFRSPSRGPSGGFNMSRLSTAAQPASSLTLALTGVSGTGVVGTLGVSVSIALTEQAGTAATGTLGPAVAPPLTQDAGTAATGTLGVTVSIALTQVAGTGGNGILSSSVTLSLTQVTSTGVTGVVLPSLSISLTNTAGTGVTGIVSPSLSIVLTGANAFSGVGFLTPVGGNPTGTNPPQEVGLGFSFIRLGGKLF